MDNMYGTPNADSPSNNNADAPQPVNDGANVEDEFLVDNFNLSTFLDEHFPEEVPNTDVPDQPGEYSTTVSLWEQALTQSGQASSSSQPSLQVENPFILGGANFNAPPQMIPLPLYTTPQATVNTIAPFPEMQGYATPSGVYEYYTLPAPNCTTPFSMMQNPMGGQYYSQIPNYVDTSPMMHNTVGGQYYSQTLTYVAPAPTMPNPTGQYTEPYNYITQTPVMQQPVINAIQLAYSTAPSTEMQPIVIGPAQNVTDIGSKRKENNAESSTSMVKRGRGRPPIPRTSQNPAPSHPRKNTLREHVLALRQYVPQATTKTDLAVILSDALEFIRSLQMQVQQLQSEKEQLLMNQGSGVMTSMQSTPLLELIHTPNQMGMETDPTMSWPNNPTGILNQAAAVGVPPISSSQDFDFSSGTSDQYPNHLQFILNDVVHQVGCKETAGGTYRKNPTDRDDENPRQVIGCQERGR